MSDEKLEEKSMTIDEIITEIYEKLNEVIEKVNKIADFLESVFGENGK